MRMPYRLLVSVFAVLAVGALFISVVVAQQQAPVPLPLQPFTQRPLAPNQRQMLSGADVGFRIEGTDANGRPTGRWMIRVDGEWVEPASVPTTRRLTN